MDKKFYKIANVTPETIMLGDSYPNEKTKVSGALDNPRWKANTIL